MGIRTVGWVTLSMLALGCSAPEGSAAVDGGSLPPDAGSGVAVLGYGSHDPTAVTIDTILDASELSEPSDLAFNPEAPTELWITCRGDDSIVVVEMPGTEAQAVLQYAGLGNTHFLPRPSALAFGQPGRMASIHETGERTQPSTPNDFMGPTLWPTARSLFDGGHASHLDMLHHTPNGVGIAWERDNVYWVIDGWHRSVTRYDFREDHGPGQEDHSDGIIARYVDGEIAYVEGVPSHAEIDHERGLLYVADTGHARVAALDLTSGTRGADIDWNENYDGGEMYVVSGASLGTVVEGGGLEQPSGLALRDGRIFVSDHATSTIHAFTTEGEAIDALPLAAIAPPGSLAGLAFDGEGRLYVADLAGSRILRITAR